MDFSRVKENLEKRGFAVTVFDTAAAAADYLDAAIDGKTVGFGGSITLQQMELAERLESHNELFWHWKVKEGETPADALKNARSAEIYVTSVNGLAESGEIINIDGTGNRVASSIYGHQKVYFVIGVNKIAPDYDAALWRARNIAAPKNAQRLGMQTPCAANGDRCYNCKSPARICRALSVLWCAPTGSQYEVVLVKEDLGY